MTVRIRILVTDIDNLKVTSLNLQNFIDGITDFLVSMTEQLDSKYDTDLLNLRDEILLLINKLKYLLTLKY